MTDTKLLRHFISAGKKENFCPFDRDFPRSSGQLRNCTKISYTERGSSVQIIETGLIKITKSTKEQDDNRIVVSKVLLHSAGTFLIGLRLRDWDTSRSRRKCFPRRKNIVKEKERELQIERETYVQKSGVRRTRDNAKRETGESMPLLSDTRAGSAQGRKMIKRGRAIRRGCSLSPRIVRR